MALIDWEVSEKVASIRQALKALGWELSYVAKDEGGLDQESVWTVTVKRQGQTFETEFSKGSGHRRWKDKAHYMVSIDRPEGGHFWHKHIRHGKRVQLPMNFRRPKKPADCKPGCRQENQNIFDAFRFLTYPEPPTLDEVMASLILDAGSVCDGQSFETFCDEFGGDTDSRKALRCYEGCTEEWRALVRLGADIPALRELFQDY